MPYEAVMFDLFGTLIDIFSRSRYDAVLRQMAHGLDVDADAFLAGWHATAADRGVGRIRSSAENVRCILSMLGQPRPAADVGAAAARRSAFVRHHIVPRPDVLPTLAELRRRGLHVGLVSNCAPAVSVAWRDTAMHAAMDIAVLSCDVGVRKPEPAIYRLAAAGLGVEPAACMFVGDGDDHELDGAAQVGMTPVQIRVAGEDAADAFRQLDEAWGGHRISRIAEVLTLLDGGRH